MRGAVEFIYEFGFQRVIIEGDVEVIIKAVNKPGVNKEWLGQNL